MRQYLQYLLITLVTVILVAPVLAITLLSLSPSYGMDVFTQKVVSARWWVSLATDSAWLSAVVGSSVVALLSATGALLVTLPAATIWRLYDWRSVQVALLLAGLSFALPPVVVAVGLYQTLVRFGLFDTLPGVAIAHLAVTVPVCAFVLTARFRVSSLAAYRTARSLGANGLASAMRWLLATQRGTILGCFAAGLLTSVSEVTITLYVTDSRVPTIAHRALAGVTRDMQPTGFAAMTAWLIVLCTVAPAILRRMEEGDARE